MYFILLPDITLEVNIVPLLNKIFKIRKLILGPLDQKMQKTHKKVQRLQKNMLKICRTHKTKIERISVDA